MWCVRIALSDLQQNPVLSSTESFFITNMGSQHRFGWTYPVNYFARRKDKRQTMWGTSSAPDTSFHQRIFVGFTSPGGQVFGGTCTQQLQLRHLEPVSATMLNLHSDWVWMLRGVHYSQPWISRGLRAFWINIKLTVKFFFLLLPPSCFIISNPILGILNHVTWFSLSYYQFLSVGIAGKCQIYSVQIVLREDWCFSIFP